MRVPKLLPTSSLLAIGWSMNKQPCVSPVQHDQNTMCYQHHCSYKYKDQFYNGCFQESWLHPNQTHSPCSSGSPVPPRCSKTPISLHFTPAMLGKAILCHSRLTLTINFPFPHSRGGGVETSFLGSTQLTQLTAGTAGHSLLCFPPQGQEVGHQPTRTCLSQP